MLFKTTVTILIILIVVVVGISALDINLRNLPKNYQTKGGQTIDMEVIKSNLSTNNLSSAKIYNKISKTRFNTVNSNINKPLFDATLYKNKNLINKSFFIPIKLLNSNLLVDENGSINPLNLIKLAKSLPKSKIPYILDIEMWKVDMQDDTKANKNIDKYIFVIDIMKKTRKDLKFGYYGVLPNRDYWTPVSNNPQKMQEWNHINKRLERLAKYVDVVCPSLYTFYNDLASWEKYAIENIKQAKKYKKPIYPFLWPQYHNSNKILRGTHIKSSFWSKELALAMKLSDGVIIWGGWREGRMNWNENASWWQATKKFIKNKQK